MRHGAAGPGAHDIYPGVGKAGTYRVGTDADRLLECAVLTVWSFDAVIMSFMRGTDWDAPNCSACDRQRSNIRATHAAARRTMMMWQHSFKVLL